MNIVDRKRILDDRICMSIINLYWISYLYHFDINITQSFSSQIYLKKCLEQFSVEHFSNGDYLRADFIRCIEFIVSCFKQHDNPYTWLISPLICNTVRSLVNTITLS